MYITGFHLYINSTSWISSPLSTETVIHVLSFLALFILFFLKKGLAI